MKAFLFRTIVCGRANWTSMNFYLRQVLEAVIKLRDKYGHKIKDRIEDAKIVIASTLLY